MKPGLSSPRRVLIAASLLVAAAPLSAAPPGSVQVEVVNTPLPVTGTVNTNITNSAVPVTGTVQLEGTAAVRSALPSEPFFDRLVINAAEAEATGTSNGALAVTTLTFTNNGDAAQKVFVFKPVLDGASCDSAVLGGSNPSLYMRLQPKQTAQLQFPTPLVISDSSGASCIAFSNTTEQVEVYVNGFIE